HEAELAADRASRPADAARAFFVWLAWPIRTCWYPEPRVLRADDRAADARARPEHALDGKLTELALNGAFIFPLEHASPRVYGSMARGRSTAWRFEELESVSPC